ncbi:SDR family NAD(P)-dependent oxidoreductase [Candidatus Woesearchaeota archaeon]|nr:SDR family NAD(P)-dependent oxidoreductase [Candidatus Woesearchaeota archaeon]
MAYKVLVTGGAGFIGSFIVDELLKKGHDVTVFDNLTEQVHRGKKPSYLNKEAKFIKGDVSDYGQFRQAVADSEIVFHQASAVGVGQSMYEIKHYCDANVMGTANLLHIIANENHSIKKILVAASMSSYGEGAYECAKCGIVYPPLRPEKQMREKVWELLCPNCSSKLKPIPTPESKPLHQNSIYAITKSTQEQITLTVGKAYGVPSVSLRYFNVYGPRQSLSNPYTGVAAIFMSRIKNGNSPVIFEDGLQTRDFISVHDVARANLMAMESKSADYQAFNVGSGNPKTIKGIAETLAKLYGKKISPKITEKFRKGDVRHCFADTSKIESKLGFKTQVSFEDGMTELAGWAEKEEAVDMLEKAESEMKSKGLIDES